MKIATSAYVPGEAEEDLPSNKISGESLVISALVNACESTSLTSLGISPDHFVAYPQEAHWVDEYIEKYGSAPSRDIFRSRWPRFPLNRHEDVRSAVDELLQHYYKSKGHEILLQASKALEQNNLEQARELFSSYQPVVTSAKPVSIVSDSSFLDMWEAELETGVPLPYAPLQRMTNGIRPGNYGIIAARTNQGKTSHAMHVVSHALTEGKNVLYYSLEMTENEMRAKLHAGLARRLGHHNITAQAVLDRSVEREDYKTFLEDVEGQDHWGEVHVHTPRHGTVTPMTLSSRIEEYDLVVIDLITLMANRKGEQSINDWRIAASISNDVKQIALEANTAVWATAQINRAGDIGDLPPKMGNLAQTDSLAQDADLVWTMRALHKGRVTAHSLEKNRHGPRGTWYTTFNPNIGDYRDISADRAEEIGVDADSED